MQIDAVDLMEMFFDRADKQRFDVIEGFARDHAGGPGAGIHGWNHVDPGRLEYLADTQLADTVVAEAEIVAADLVFPGTLALDSVVNKPTITFILISSLEHIDLNLLALNLIDRNIGRMIRLKGIEAVSCGVAPSVSDMT